MTDATELWAAVVVSHAEQSLKELTNIRNRTATGLDTDFGVDAAQSVINLWPAYVQATYDNLDPLHVEVGKRAVIAILWQRGGTSSAIAKVEWESVFTDSMVDKIKRTGPRGRQGPKSNSGIRTSSERLSDGSSPLGWSDPNSLPVGLLSSRRGFDNR